MKKILVFTACLAWCAGTAAAGEKKLMHCFVFAVKDTATEADWDAFHKATDALPGKIPGLSRTWRGKLRAPLTILSANAEARKKLAAGEQDVAGTVNRTRHAYGVCMEMDGPDALKVYADHAAHKEWEDVYFKVRVPGSTSFDILGQ
jgi:hypothetical protein